MRRDQPTTPFDVEAEDLTQQFWGASKGWISSEQPAARRRAEHRSAQRDPAPNPAPNRDDTTGSLRVIREGFAAFRPQTSANATGEITRQRQHGAPRRRAQAATHDPGREATLGELAAGWHDDRGHRDGGVHHDDHHDDHFDADYLDDDYLDMAPAGPRHQPARLAPEHEVPLTPVQPLVERLGLGAVDPLLVRAGVFLLALILLVPVMLSLRPDRGDTLPGDVVDAPQQVVAGAAAPGSADDQLTPSADAADTTSADTTSAETASDEAASAAAPSTQPTTDAAGTELTTVDTVAAIADAPATTADAATNSSSGDDAAAVDVVAERIVPACPQTYTAAPGDSWYRIAEEAGVTPTELLAENNATTETVILPGDDICLPEGAAMPTPPTTVAPTTTEADEPAPSTTEAPATTAPATTAPATTVAPVANLTRAEVQELIRQTWPEDEVETALEVARRESNFIATADNGWCCVGVFQIYWSVHSGWLDDFGITERSDLFDARKNIAAAHHMWEQSGWGPWGG